MKTIVYTNLLLLVIISTCAAAGLTDEQLAQIFNEKPERDGVMSNNRDDFASIQDMNELDQTLAAFIGDSEETSNIFDNEMVDDQGALEDDDLDLALLQKTSAYPGDISKANNVVLNKNREIATDLQTCLQIYGNDYELCEGLLETGKNKDSDFQMLCTTESCLYKLETLFKRKAKRDVSSECQTIDCKINQLVKKSFCNRYGCGRRRKKTDRQTKHRIMYPEVTSLNVFGRRQTVQERPSRAFGSKQTRSVDLKDSERGTSGLCGSTIWACTGRMTKTTGSRRNS